MANIVITPTTNLGLYIKKSKMMKWLIVIGLLFSSFMVRAHQVEASTTMLVEQENGEWILQIRSALTAFEYEVHAHYGKDSYTTPEKFQELAISHMMENLSISFNEKDAVTLENPFIKLGHETNALFKVIGVPETINSVTVKNSSFQDVGRNQSALVILKKGFAKKQFILSKTNNHQITLITKDSQFLQATEGNQTEIVQTDISSGAKSWTPYFIIIGLVAMSLIFLFLKKRS